MRTLIISKCTELTMTALSNVIPQLKYLKKVTLPQIIKNKESSLMLSKSIMEKLSIKMPLVEFDLSESSDNECLFRHPKHISAN